MDLVKLTTGNSLGDIYFNITEITIGQGADMIIKGIEYSDQHYKNSSNSYLI